MNGGFVPRDVITEGQLPGAGKSELNGEDGRKIAGRLRPFVAIQAPISRPQVRTVR